MASISTPTPPKLHFLNLKFSTLFPLRTPSYPSPSLPFSLHSHSLSADSITLCHYLNHSSGSSSSSDNSVNRRWDSLLHDVIRNAVKRFDSYINSLLNESQGARKTANVAQKDSSKKKNLEPEDEEWDWD